MSNFDIVPLREPIEGLIQTVKLPQYFFKPHTRNPDFFGRDEILARLKSALHPSRKHEPSELKSFALCGAGGLGKTSIAVEFAYANKTNYEAIFILQASDTEKLSQSFADISVALGLESDIGDQIVSKHIVLGWLSQPVRHIQAGTTVFEGEKKDLVSWLLVFDNADDLNVLRDFWPESECGSVLVTSRDPLAKTRSLVPVTQGIDLEPFVAHEAGLLLRNLTGYSNRKNVEPSEKLAAELSGLPLALTQIAGTICRRDLGFDEFLSLYKEEALRRDFFQDSLQIGAKTLYSTWNIDDLSASALCLLNIITFLDPDQISEDAVLMKMASVEKQHQLKDYPISVGEFMGARAELAKSSLVKRNQERKELIIHRIIQDTARSRIDANDQQVCFSGASHLLYTSWPFSEFDFSTARWRLCEPVLAHVANLHRIYQNSKTFQEVVEVRPQLARLFMDMGW